jgi:predicted TIM-barrel fold metal-dependent hydrolase
MQVRLDGKVALVTGSSRGLGKGIALSLARAGAKVAMNYANDRPYDLGHPRHIDNVAIDFPELRIIAGLSGWPWISDMIGLLRRHPNLYCDTAAHRPRYFATPGSGWEQFLQFGNTLSQEKIMVGLSRGLMKKPFESLIAEYENLPLKETVIEKWLYHNAARFFRRD